MMDGAMDSAADLAVPAEAPAASPDSGEVDIAAKSAEIAAAADSEVAPKPEGDEPEAPKPEDEPEAPKPEDEPKDDEVAPDLAEAQAVVADLTAKVEKLEALDQEWRSSALETLVQNRALADKVELLERYLEAAGVSVDDRDLEILELRAEGYTNSIKDQASKHGATKQQEAKVTARATELRIDAEKTAKESGIPMDLLLARWNALCDKTGKTVPFADASKSLRNDLNRAATAKQVAANSAVKKPLPRAGGESSSKPNFAPPTTDEGIRQRLAAKGFNVD